MIGRIIGNYRFDALLGSGGMGAVYRGLDLMLERPVAIKALRADVAAQPHLVERFRQEARTLARLHHPHIATLYALLREPAPAQAGGDDLYMVMEFCEGETFESILRRERRLHPARARALFRQALDGIGHAHQHGIVHRDIKPANLMLAPGGTVKVMDFGIARLLGSSRMTQTHHTVGTAEYMAPEQVRSHEVDARADVYALGVLLYELVTGRVPFESDSFFEVMQAHLQTPPPPPRRLAPDLPEAFEAALLRALEKSPDDRFPSADAFRDALDAVPLPEAPLPAPPEASRAATTPSSKKARPAKPSKKASAEPAPTVLAAPVPSGRAPGDTAEITLTPEQLASKLPVSDQPGATILAPKATAPAPPAPARSGRARDALLLPLLRLPRPALAGLALALVALLGVTTWALTSGGTPDAADALAEAQPTEPTVEAGAPGGAFILPSNPSGALRTPTPLPMESGSQSAQTEPEPRSAPAEPSREAPAERTERRTEPTPGTEPIAAAPTTGRVRIVVRPFGDVYVDGRQQASGTNAPVFAELSPGPHRVRVTHPVFGAQERTVQVAAGRTAEVLVEFDTPAEVTVVSDPANAEILVDGRSTGRYTPATVTLQPGRHTVEVRRDGHRPDSRSVTIAAGRSPDRLSFTLSPEN